MCVEIELQFEAESTCTIFSIIIFVLNEEPKQEELCLCLQSLLFFPPYSTAWAPGISYVIPAPAITPQKTPATPKGGCFTAAESAERGEENVNVGLF